MSQGNPWKTGCLVILLLFAGCSAFGGYALYRGWKEKPLGEKVVDEVLVRLSQGDAVGTHPYLAPSLAPGDVDKLAKENPELFTGYVPGSAKSDGFFINTTPAGTFMKLSGPLSYDSGLKGKFEATVQSADGRWMLAGLYVTAPPEKLREGADARPAPDSPSASTPAAEASPTP